MGRPCVVGDLMEPLPETAEALREMASYGNDSAAVALYRIKRQVLEVVPDCVGISLGLQVENFTFTLVANDDLARDLDVVQYVDDGPCVTAMASGQAQETTAADLLDEGRWLMFARTQKAHGVESTLSLPITRENRVVAGVNLYASTPDAFDGHHEELAAICGSSSSAVVSNADLAFTTRRDAVATPARMADENDVHAAVGMLAEVQRLNIKNAETRLEQAAARAGISKTQAARVIIRALSAMD